MILRLFEAMNELLRNYSLLVQSTIFFQNNLPSINYILLYENRMLVSDSPLLWPNIADRFLCQISLPIALVVVRSMYSARCFPGCFCLIYCAFALSRSVFYSSLSMLLPGMSFRRHHLFLPSPLILCLYCLLLPPFTSFLLAIHRRLHSPCRS